ncbi:hypothetical protein D3C78_1248940 [compost metagenome]
MRRVSATLVPKRMLCASRLTRPLMSSKPVRSARWRSASVLEIPARISALTSASSSASSPWLTDSSSATRSMDCGSARPDSTQTTSRSRASGKAARSERIRACLRLST